MTEKLYDRDPYLYEAEGRVLLCQRAGDAWHAVLDRTIFYARGGGQPCEGGTINGVAVADVYEENGDIIHVLGARVAPGPALMKINFDRRFDHMQQHLGEHILSAVIERRFGGKISILRIEEDSSHIEIDRPLAIEQLLQAQEETNRIIDQNLPVPVHYMTPREAEDRGVPHGKAEAHARVRVVEIPGIDFNGCGGTHCNTTGEVGRLVICGAKPVRGLFRIYFKCGARALAEEQARTAGLLALQEAFGAELRPEMQQKALDTLARKNHLEELCRQQKEQLLELDCRLYAATAQKIGQRLFICQAVEGGDAKHVKAVADLLAARHDAVVLFAVEAGGQASLIFCRSKSKEPQPNLGQLLRTLAQAHGGKGGGSVVAAQGMMEATPASRQAFLALGQQLGRELEAQGEL